MQIAPNGSEEDYPGRCLDSIDGLALLEEERIQGGGVSWCSDIPEEVKIGNRRFVVAGEALEQWDYQLNGPGIDGAKGDRPNPDWPAATMFVLARVQLEQIVEILMSTFGIDGRLFSGTEVSRRLTEIIESVPGGSRAAEDFSYQVDAVGEGIDLWRAIRESPGIIIHHAFEFDGSVTLTIGPELPELPTLGIQPSYEGGELNADPSSIFPVASLCTSDAAELAVRYKIWKRIGYQPEPDETTPPSSSP